MPSSKARRSPARTFLAMGRKRWSVRMSSLMETCRPVQRSRPRAAWPIPPVPYFGVSHLPESRGRSPEQKERNTNIAVHREKRSVEPAQIVRLDQGMFVSEERRDHDQADPSGPGEGEAGGEPGQQCDHSGMHG